MLHTVPPRSSFDQMLMAGYILQALEHGGMPMHAAGYRELAGWATDELGQLDSGTLQDVRYRVPRALRDIIENLLHERRQSECPVCGLTGLTGLNAQSTCRVLLQRFRAQRPA